MGAIKDAVTSIPKILKSLLILTENLSKVQANVEKLQDQNVKILERLAPAEERLKQLEKHVEKDASTIQQQQDKISKLENEIATLKARQEDLNKIHLQEIQLNKHELEKHIAKEVKIQMGLLQAEFTAALKAHQVLPPTHISAPKTFLSPGSSTQVIDDGES